MQEDRPPPGLRRALEHEELLDQPLGLVVGRVRLARDDKLERALAGEQRKAARVVLHEQRQALVGGRLSRSPARAPRPPA